MTDIAKHFAEGGLERILKARSIYEHGTHAQLPAFQRFVVLDVVFDPRIIDKAKLDYWEHSLEVSNMEWGAVLPRNTIIAQRVLEGTAEPPMFLFPFFPSHFALPCKPGEHVWVMFESPGTKDHTLGYWMCRITEPDHADDVNHTHAARAFEPSFIPKIKDVFNGTADPKYEFRNGMADEQDGERYTIPESRLLPSTDETVYEKLLTNADGSQLVNYESIPRYRKRPGDIAFEGSNNTLIVLGTDRTGPVADLSKPAHPKKGIVPAKKDDDMDGSAGMIDLVAGRGQTDDTRGKEVTSKKIDKSDFNKELGKSGAELVDKEGDPDIKADRSRVLIVQRTKIDKNLGLADFNKSNFPDSKGMPGSGLKDPDKGAGGIIIRSDKVRIVARMDVEILVSGFEKDDKGNAKALTDPDKYAAIVIKSSGDIIFRPAKEGYIKLGDDTADRALLCTDSPAIAIKGAVSPATPALTTTMGGAFGGTSIPTQGTWAKKVLVTGAK